MLCWRGNRGHVEYIESLRSFVASDKQHIQKSYPANMLRLGRSVIAMFSSSILCMQAKRRLQLKGFVVGAEERRKGDGQ